MSRNVEVVTAAKNNIISKSTFNGYDACINSYVGCEMGCCYCYVNFFIKDERPWGEFVRTRDHLHTKLPKELQQWGARGKQRIVMGTMTDVYQPQERKSRLTRAAINYIIEYNEKASEEHKIAKVGIFTRSPIVLDDLEIIKKLPNPRVHFTITPYEREILVKLEPIPIMTSRRFDVVQKIKDAGIRVHVNVAPAIPLLSEKLTDDFAQQLAKIGVAQFFIDPMQAYSSSFDATFKAISDLPEWTEISAIMKNKTRYLVWKEEYRSLWKTAWEKYGNPDTLAIWCDHENKIWNRLLDGVSIDKRLDGDNPETT